MNDSTNPQDMIQTAWKAYEDGQFQISAEQFRSAAQEYLNQKDPLSAAEMYNNCGVALLKSGQNAAAWEVVQGTDKTFEEAGDIHRQSLALGNQADIKSAMGDHKAALELFQKSSELLKAQGDHETRAIVLKSISSLQIRTGAYLQALATMHAALNEKQQLAFQEKMLLKLLNLVFKQLPG